jgi:hypothetical protein
MSEKPSIKPLKQPEEDDQEISAQDGANQGAAVPQVDPDLKVLSQSEIDVEHSLIRLKTERLRLEREQLELIKLTNDVGEIKRKNENAQMNRQAAQDALNFERETRISNETYCTHMKGGDSATMMHGGPAQGNNASNYAVIDHTFTTGVRIRLCQRCGKTWFPGDPDYRLAMSWPTRNSPSSGSPSPGLVRVAKNVRLVSEVPHRSIPVVDYGLTEYNFPNAK